MEMEMETGSGSVYTETTRSNWKEPSMATVPD